MHRVRQALQSARSHMCVDYCGLGLSVSGLRNHRESVDIQGLRGPSKARDGHSLAVPVSGTCVCRYGPPLHEAEMGPFLRIALSGI